MAFTTALYYPWIEVREEAWLKTACLYWEGIRTIVPESLQEPYTNSVSRELADAGILQPLLVNPYMPEIEDLALDLLSCLDSQEAAELMLGRSTGNTVHIHLDKLPKPIWELTHLHPDNLPQKIMHCLQHFGPPEGPWLSVESSFADYYMTLLATKLSEGRALGLLTSSFAADRLANVARSGSRSWCQREQWPYLSGRPRRLRRSQTTSGLVEGSLVDLLMQGIAVSPSVSLKSLLRFRQKHSDELGRLRVKIGDLAASVSRESSLEAVRQQANDLLANQVMPALADLRAALKASRIKTLTEGLLKISALSVAPTSALAVAGLPVSTALAIGAGISLTAMAALYAVERENVLRNNPFSYLLSLEKHFGAQKVG